MMYPPRSAGGPVAAGLDHGRPGWPSRSPERSNMPGDLKNRQEPHGLLPANKATSIQAGSAIRLLYRRSYCVEMQPAG